MATKKLGKITTAQIGVRLKTLGKKVRVISGLKKFKGAVDLGIDIHDLRNRK